MTATRPHDTVVWVVRPIVWFIVASIGTTVLHELAHAVTAFALGVPSTLFNYSAQIHLTQAQAAANLAVLIGVAGPLFCLALGIVCLLAFRRARGSAAELPLLYFTVFAIGTFFGNLMSASFVGDFSAAAIGLGLPMIVRYVLTVAGALCVAVIHYRAGVELIRWVPAHVGKVTGMLGIVVLTVAAGTVVVILVNWPMPAASMSARIAESAFWLFAAAGALMTGSETRGTRERLGLRWIDGGAILLAVLAVRLMVRGIPFSP